MLISFLGSLPLATMNVAAVQISISEGITSALLFSLGSLTVEMIYVRISVVAITWIQKQKKLFRILEYVTLLIVLALAASSFYAAMHPEEQKNVVLSSTLPKFLLGAAMCAVSPGQIPFWLGWSTVLFTKKILLPRNDNYNAYIAGIGIGTLIGNCLFIFGGMLIANSISRNQHMMRLDAEVSEDLLTEDEDRLLYAFENYIAAEDPDVIILEDYNKGVLTQSVIKRIISLCKKHKILTAVDPKRKNFFAYESVDIFKPNFKEIKDGLNILTDDVNLHVLQDMHLLLQDKLKHRISLITLSAKGVFFQQDNDAAIIPTHIRSIADVSGAGDTVIAVASLVFAVTADAKIMAEIANIAGGLVCEEVGTVAIDKEKLIEECRKLLT